MKSLTNPKTTLFAGVLTAIAASACCVGPLLLLSVGIGGAWIGNLTALEPYRPFFIGVSVLLVVLAFRQVYFSNSRCSPSQACTTTGAGKKIRLVFWLAVVLVLGSIATPWIVGKLYQ